MTTVRRPPALCIAAKPRPLLAADHRLSEDALSNNSQLRRIRSSCGREEGLNTVAL